MADASEQKPLVAFLGPPSSFTHQVSLLLTGTRCVEKVADVEKKIIHLKKGYKIWLS